MHYFILSIFQESYLHLLYCKRLQILNKIIQWEYYFILYLFNNIYLIIFIIRVKMLVYFQNKLHKDMAYFEHTIRL